MTDGPSEWQCVFCVPAPPPLPTFSTWQWHACVSVIPSLSLPEGIL